MSRDYEMAKFIRQNLQEYNDKFRNAVVNLFNRMVEYREPNGCMSNSAMLLACARYCGYEAKMCYGLCYTGTYEFYHAWLEIGGKVLDISIYGNSNFSPYYLDEPLERPIINCSYDETPIRYGRFVFDEDWPEADLSRVEGLSLEKYFDNSEKHILWQYTCGLLELSPIKSNGDAIREAIKGIVIEPDNNIQKEFS